MADLKTTYLGLSLKNPLIVSSSGLTGTVEKIKELEKKGAGAVVLKSLFEEQINHEAGNLVEESMHTESFDYIKSYLKSHSVDNYIQLIRQCKQDVSIPVIASINCVSAGDWTSFAKKIEQAGADALEINLFFVPNNKNAGAEKYENTYIDILKNIKDTVSIPVSIKLGCYFTNLTNLVNSINNMDVQGVVLFNRFYQPDIDIENFSFSSGETFSTPSDMFHTLRWVAIISGTIRQIDIAASTGIHDGQAAIKQILAGAKCVQVCSVLYKKGAGQIQEMLEDIEKWMDKHNIKHIEDFRGRMSYKNIPDPSVYERAQFMKYFAEIT